MLPKGEEVGEGRVGRKERMGKGEGTQGEEREGEGGMKER